MPKTALKERTFILIKPDAVQRGLIGSVISRIEAKGLKIVALKMLQVTPEQAAKQYSCHKGKPFYDSLVEFITSAPAVAIIVEGRNAVPLCRKLMGATDPLKAEPGTIRGDFSGDMKQNIVHGSDSQESFRHESSVFFTEDEIVEYKIALEQWIYYT